MIKILLDEELADLGYEEWLPTDSMLKGCPHSNARELAQIWPYAMYLRNALTALDSVELARQAL